MQGKFIVIEGIDGCGKSTQINEIYKWLPKSGLLNKNCKVIKTREPGGSILGQKIREIILSNDKDNQPSYITELLLYNADRAEHIDKVISPALSNNHWVISDRFTGSTLAYQGYGRNINLLLIKQLEKIACQGKKPDLTIFLEISPEESVARRKNKIADRIESEGINFLRKVNDGFKLMAKNSDWETVSASQNINSVSTQIKKILINKFQEK